MKFAQRTGSSAVRHRAFLAWLTILVALVSIFANTDVSAAEASQNTPPAEVLSIRVADHTRYQRVVIDTSAAVSSSILEDTVPLTLRIEEVQATPQTLTWSDLGLLKGITVQHDESNTANISFDVSSPVRPRVSSYTPDNYGGHRIVIDLWPIKKPKAQSDPEETQSDARINEWTVGALDHQPTANQASGLTSDEFWPDLGASSEDEAEDLMEVPGLKIVQQWPDLLEEAAKTIRENENAAAFPAESGTGPTDSVSENIAGLELKPALAPQTPSKDIDPITAARRSLAQGQPGDACKVLQLNYPKGTWNIEAMVLQGGCLSALGKLIDANTLYTEVLSFEPGNLDARLGLAKSQAGAGDYNAARDNYTRALENMSDGIRKDETRRLLETVEDQIKHAIH